jgi:hypothetical protein
MSNKHDNDDDDDEKKILTFKGIAFNSQNTFSPFHV